MKAKILLLIISGSLVLGCRSKHKITTIYKENTKETETVKIDSSKVQSSQSIHTTSADAVLVEKKNEISGDLLIKGTSDASNPFVFHNVVGSDTIQSISIMGTAEYIIRNHYAKADHQKSEGKKEESAHILQEATHETASKEAIREVDSKISEETKKIQMNGLDVAAWIFITVMGITLILLIFTYKYFKQ